MSEWFVFCLLVLVLPVCLKERIGNVRLLFVHSRDLTVHSRDLTCDVMECLKGRDKTASEV